MWLCVVMCDCVWLCVAVCGCVWWCVAVCGCVSLCVAVCGYVWCCVVVSIRVEVGSYDGFLSIWIRFVALLAVREPISRYSDVFWQFHKSLSHLLTQGSLITTKIRFEPAEHESEERAWKRSKKNGTQA